MFRILLGLYLTVETVVGRLSLGRYDIAWYTSNEPTSYLLATDTPHQAPLHQIWFYRGSNELQYALFVLTAVTAVCFATGCFTHGGPLKVGLFLLVTAQQNRNMYVHDSSDTYVRHLLLWSCFLPLSQVWSVDAYWKRKKAIKAKKPPITTSASATSFTTTTTTTMVVSTLPAYAMAVQILLMYWGTVLARTIDRYGWSLHQLAQPPWLPPQLSAVHYALSGAFAVRDNALNVLVQSHPILGQGLTATVMLVECWAPLGCLLYRNVQYRLYCAAILMMLHAVLLLHLRLPQYQCLAILTQTLWIPSHIWDSLPLLVPSLRSHQKDGGEGRVRTTTTNNKDSDSYKKTDGDVNDVFRRRTTTTDGPAVVVEEPKQLQPHQPRPQQLRRVQRLANRSPVMSRGIQVFLASYMLYNWLGERQWIAKHDHGDIGEGLRLSQHWIVPYDYYAQNDNSTVAHNSLLTGVVVAVAGGDNRRRRRVDLWHYLTTGRIEFTDDVVVDDDGRTVEVMVPLDMSRRYPSARWERALHGWAAQSMTMPEYGRERGLIFLRALCILVNQDLFAQRVEGLQEMELRFQHIHIRPPGSHRQRYDTPTRASVDTVVTVSCKPLPSPFVSPPLEPPSGTTIVQD